MKALVFGLSMCFCLCTGPFRSSAQQVVGTAGTEFSYATGTIAFTIGETTILSEENADLIHSVGFHQIYLVTTPTRAVFDDGYIFEVFPNPARTFVQITTEKPSEQLSVVLYNESGQKLRTLPFSESVVRLHTGDLASGLYILSIVSANRLIRSFKILKP